jgi:hypothetical protein
VRDRLAYVGQRCVLGLSHFSLGRLGLLQGKLLGQLALTQQDLTRRRGLLVGPRPGSVEVPVAVDR